jgi:hypothetical protein
MLAGGSFSLTEACSRAARVQVPAVPSVGGPSSDPRTRALCELGLGAALDAGARYADVRIGDSRTQMLRTREARVVSVNDNDSRGFGIFSVPSQDGRPSAAAPRAR